MAKQRAERSEGRRETPDVWKAALAGATAREQEAVGVAAVWTVLLMGEPKAFTLMHTSHNGGC